MRESRRAWALWAAAACLLACLAGCAGKSEPFDPAETTRALLDEPGVFSETLEEMDRDIFLALYDLEEDTLTAGAVYGSTGATAEEVAVFVFADEDAAEAALGKLQERLEDQRESNVDYRPDEMPKLDAARIQRRGASVLYLVAADREKADKLLGD